MRLNKLILIILFLLASCSVDMDSDLETSITSGNISDSSSDLPGTIFTGDNSTTTTTYLYSLRTGKFQAIFP